MWTAQDCSSLEFLYRSPEDYISGGGFSHCLVVCVICQPTPRAGWLFSLLGVPEPSREVHGFPLLYSPLCPRGSAWSLSLVTGGQSDCWPILLPPLNLCCLGLLSHKLRTVTATALQRTLKVNEKTRGPVLEVKLWKQK